MMEPVKKNYCAIIVYQFTYFITQFFQREWFLWARLDSALHASGRLFAAAAQCCHGQNYQKDS